MNFDFLNNLNMPKKSDPDKVHKRHVQSRKIHINPRHIIIAFAVAVILLSAVSVLTVVKEKDKAATETTAEASPTGETSETDTTAVLNDEFFAGNILLAFTRDGNKDLHYIAVVNFDDETNGIKVSYVPTTTVCTVDEITATMKEHLEDGGITELLWAVGDMYSISISKYVLFDENDFVKIMKRIGDTEISVEEHISHSINGLNFIIEEGTQTLTAEAMLKYYIYLCDEMWNDLTPLTNVTASIAKRIANFDDSSVEEIYNKFVNNISTDLSAIDVKTYESQIYNISKNASLDRIEIVQDPAQFLPLK